MKKNAFLLLVIGLLALAGHAQTATGRSGNKPAKQPTNDRFEMDTVDGDTIVYYTLKPVKVYSQLRTFKKQKDQNHYNRLVRNVKKVYPYAHRAGIMLKEEEANMSGMDKGDRRAHMKKVEKRLEQEFGPELKALNYTQGRILLKLIDRETGQTSYNLVDDLRGSFRAWFYDGLAGLFGYDLKSEYDPHNHLEDRYIEEVVRMIEAGEL